MQYGPDNVPISNASIVVGPPTKNATPIDATTTIYTIEPLNYGGGNNWPPPYQLIVQDEGNTVTGKATLLNFVGQSVEATANNGNVTITIDTTGVASILGGAGISVSSTSGVFTIENTGLLGVTGSGNGISVTTNGATQIATIRNTFTETVYDGGNAAGNLTPNRNNGTVQKFNLTGNVSLQIPANMTTGQSITLILTQDPVGNRILSTVGGYLFASGQNTLSTNGDSIDMLNIFTDGSYYYTTLTVGYTA